MIELTLVVYYKLQEFYELKGNFDFSICKKKSSNNFILIIKKLDVIRFNV